MLVFPCMCICVYVCVYTCMRVCACVCMCVRVCACVCMYTYLNLPEVDTSVFITCIVISFCDGLLKISTGCTVMSSSLTI